ncbi:GIY-YIG nuclease family protein [Ochrobactrum sp. S1502_03]|uniref:GIY-YIG nuclease family protein n=1 Tax=Ochrobactrum sp. S1502_03 TaxID=3108451 RepID=UPI0037C946BB
MSPGTFMGGLNNPDLHHRQLIPRYEDVIEEAIIGDGNKPVSSLAELRNLKLLVAASKQITNSDHTAVYVIGEENASRVKVGKARSPIHRLATLQTGNPDTLFLHRVFWFDTAICASGVEEQAHIIAEQEHYRLEGEWFECKPHEAHDHIVEAAQSLRSGYCALTPSKDTPYVQS